MRAILLFALSGVMSMSSAVAQVTEFPMGAQPIAAASLQDWLVGKSFRVAPAKSSPWLLEFQAGGRYSIKTDSGYADSGSWRVEESRLCTAPQKSKASCNDMRLLGEVLYLKRDSGEIVKFEPR